MATLANQGVASQMSFGQHGSAYCNTDAGEIVPPTGKVIVAVQFLVATTLTDLIAEDPDQYVNTASAAHNSAAGSETAQEGSGGLALPTTAVFPAGLSIYGRWIKIEQADSDNTAGGYIVYFGPK
jgi:hypothetical protein|tara:strand:- start:1091 stop:1465 length:375 start_codon:yes stop_codon:yes gene_type:complete